VYRERIATIAGDPRVRRALKNFELQVEQAIDLAIAIQQIPAPTFAESERASFIAGEYQRLGLEEVSQDELHNVYGRYPGTAVRPPVVVTAHLDTVFPADTDLGIRRDGSLIYGPGLADNSTGVAALLILANTVAEFGLRSPAAIWLVATVGEEGLGNLRGIRAVTERFGSEATYIVVEGGSFGQIFHRGIGVRRYRIEVQAPGGHSWGNFGNPSAIHILGRIIAGISALPTPDTPKTTYNVGLIEGGTSVNSIAERASLLLDLRSEGHEPLQQLIAAVEAIVRQESAIEGVTAAMTLIGDRPAGKLPREAGLVRLAEAALRYVGQDEVELLAGSTDANIPLSLGSDALCIGIARSGNAHRRDEFLDTTKLVPGLSQLLLLTLAAAGFAGES
jgi:acetylornithine deacetylase/succinyl-diaminopimelate desuccinylase-like protein